MFDQIVAQLSIVAVFAQSLIDLVKPLYQKYSNQATVDKVLCILVSVVLAHLWGLNLLEAAGIHVVPLAGESVTGFVSALGSSVLNQVLYLLKILKEHNLPTSL